MSVIVYPSPKIVKKFNTIVFSGGTGIQEWPNAANFGERAAEHALEMYR